MVHSNSVTYIILLCLQETFTIVYSNNVTYIILLCLQETFTMVYSNNVTNVTLHYCNETQQSGKFAIYQFVVLFGAPGTLMVVCYTYVIRELWRSTRSMQALTNNVR
jgi:hypothetical protein